MSFSIGEVLRTPWGHWSLYWLQPALLGTNCAVMLSQGTSRFIGLGRVVWIVLFHLLLPFGFHFPVSLCQCMSWEARGTAWLGLPLSTCWAVWRKGKRVEEEDREGRGCLCSFTGCLVHCATALKRLHNQSSSSQRRLLTRDLLTQA